MNRIDHDLRMVGLVKGEERYIALYDAPNRCDALRTIGRWASNPDLSLTWYDAAKMVKRIREDVHEH